MNGQFPLSCGEIYRRHASLSVADMGEDYDYETTNIHEFLASSFFSAYVTIIRVVMGTTGENSGESDCIRTKGARVDRRDGP